MLAVLALLAVTILAVVALQSRAGVWWLKQELHREARDVAKSFTNSFVRLDDPSDERQVDDLVALSFSDPHVAFVAVRNAEGEIISRQIRDAVAYSGYAAAVNECNDHLLCDTCASYSIQSSDGVSGHASGVTLWTPDEELFGVVTIGIVDPAFATIGKQLANAGLAAGLVVGAFAVPLVAMGARRLAAPLRRVAAAAESLATGGRPDALRRGGPREVDSLACSFNRMASSLDDASRELHEANARLESTVEQRTRELRTVNDRLQLELNERARFFRAMSHDLGAPLRNIAGSLVLIRKRHARELPEDTIQAFDRIERSVDLELRMIRELLEITRLGAAEERPEVVEAAGIVSDVRVTLQHELTAREIDFVAEAPMPVIRVEAARFRQVVQNLVDNAIKYMPDRAPRTITVSARFDEQGAEFTVADTGAGIPPKEQERVFEVFRRASNIPAHVAGAGVGLAAVKAIVERWGGAIRLESELGVGSRFIFSVPADRIVSIPPDGRDAASQNAEAGHRGG